jgi:hypothetical protein
MAGIRAGRGLAAGLVAVSLLALGCGGDDDEETTEATGAGPEVVSQPEPSESISTRIEAYNDAVADQDCERFAPLAFSLARETTEPGASPSRPECRDAEAALRDLRGVELDDDAEFGTGAIAEGTPPRRSSVARTVTVWVVDRDGSYRLLLTADSPPQVDTEVAEEAAVEETATEFVDAVQSDDCEALTQLIDPGGRLATGSPKERCEAIADGQLFAPALEATPDPELEYLGGTSDFAFVGVPTEDAYFTIVLGTEEDGGEPAATILDVLPSTELELPEPGDSG